MGFQKEPVQCVRCGAKRSRRPSLECTRDLQSSMNDLIRRCVSLPAIGLSERGVSVARLILSVGIANRVRCDQLHLNNKPTMNSGTSTHCRQIRFSRSVFNCSEDTMSFFVVNAEPWRTV
jgi:hypothetical protein